MNVNKRMAFVDEQTKVGIHTGNGTTKDIVDLDKVSNNSFIETCNIRKARNEEHNETYMRINPNKKYNG